MTAALACVEVTMSDTLQRVQRLVAEGKVRVSHHGNEELSEDRISARTAIEGLIKAEILEDYPDTGRGPSILVLEHDNDIGPFHVVWGIGKGLTEGPAVLVTAYRPDPNRWQSPDFSRRTT